jgi:hypothetical protein
MHYFIFLFPSIPPPADPPHLHTVVILSSFLLLLAEEISCVKLVCLVFMRCMILMLAGEWQFFVPLLIYASECRSYMLKLILLMLLPFL